MKTYGVFKEVRVDEMTSHRVHQRQDWNQSWSESLAETNSASSSVLDVVSFSP